MIKKHILDRTHGVFLPLLKTKLEEHYGTGITIHVSTATDLIFECPGVCNKFIKINSSAVNKFKVYLGDSISSDTTLVNTVNIQEDNEVSGAQTFYMVLGDNFMLFTAVMDVPYTVLIGTMTNGYHVAIAGIQWKNGANSGWRFGYIVETGLTCGLLPVNLALSDAIHPEGYLVKVHLMFVDHESKLLVNSDGSPASLEGVYMSPLKTEVLTSDRVFVRRHVWNYTGSVQFGNITAALLVELDYDG